MLIKGSLCHSISFFIPSYSNVVWRPAKFNMFARLHKTRVFADDMHDQKIINIKVFDCLQSRQRIRKYNELFTRFLIHKHVGQNDSI